MTDDDIQVLLVDDHELLLRGLSLVLSTVPGITVAGTALNGHKALSLLDSLTVDVVVTDAAMPGMDGTDLTRRIRMRYPHLPVLVLTTFSEPRLVSELVERGASGYVLKDVPAEELARAIRQVHDGGLVLDPRIARYARGRAASPLSELTPMEERVAKLIGEGATNREIAASLSLSVGTVKNHVSSILRKTGSRDRTNLALLVAKAHGLK